MVRANEMAQYKDIDNGDWKFLNFDTKTNKLVVPIGSMGQRWDGKDGNWNLTYTDDVTGAEYDPELTFIDQHDDVAQVEFVEYGLDKKAMRGVPVRYITSVDGEKIPVATIYDLTMSQYGVSRGLAGDYPTSYDDKDQAYTPAWQEIFTELVEIQYYN